MLQDKLIAQTIRLGRKSIQFQAIVKIKIFIQAKYKATETFQKKLVIWKKLHKKSSLSYQGPNMFPSITS